MCVGQPASADRRRHWQNASATPTALATGRCRRALETRRVARMRERWRACEPRIRRRWAWRRWAWTPTAIPVGTNWGCGGFMPILLSIGWRASRERSLLEEQAMARKLALLVCVVLAIGCCERLAEAQVITGPLGGARGFGGVPITPGPMGGLSNGRSLDPLNGRSINLNLNSSLPDISRPVMPQPARAVAVPSSAVPSSAVRSSRPSPSRPTQAAPRSASQQENRSFPRAVVTSQRATDPTNEQAESLDESSTRRAVSTGGKPPEEEEDDDDDDDGGVPWWIWLLVIGAILVVNSMRS